MKKVFVIVLFLIFSKVESQEVLKDYGSWLTMINKVKLTEKVSFVNVSQQRRVYFLKQTQAYLFAPSINFKINNNLSVGGGYLFYKYLTHGVSHASIPKNEHRYFQNLTYLSKLNSVKINQRLQFEQRYIEKVIDDEIVGKKYAQRLRYRIAATFNLYKKLEGKISNETRIRFTSGFNNPDFDQNNFEALLGYPVFKNTKIWMGYGRYYFKKKDQLFVSNDLLHVTINHTLDLRK